MLQPPPQPELDLDHAPALEEAMRSVFESRWSRWHAKTFDEAVKDPLTRQLLVLTVQRGPKPPTARRRRSRCP